MKTAVFLFLAFVAFSLSALPGSGAEVPVPVVSAAQCLSEESYSFPSHADYFAIEAAQSAVPSPMRKQHERQQKISCEIWGGCFDQGGVSALHRRGQSLLSSPLLGSRVAHDADYLRFGILVI